MFPKPISVKPLPHYRIWLKYSDGTNGEVNLSHLANKGVFVSWENSDFFNGVYIDKETDAVAWSASIELCPDNLFLKITGKSFQEFLEENLHHASD